jgi:hypothetical protein
MLSQLISSKLESPQGLSSYRQIVEWLEQEWHVQVKYKTVYSLVLYKLVVCQGNFAGLNARI